jgi:transposase-like protein
MKRKLLAPEQIVKKLREADAAITTGSTVEQVCRQLQISDATYYNWGKQYGQMKLGQVKQLKSLQKENAQLKKLVADLSIDKAILKEALSGNY